jgi:hypothetical protein
MCARLLGGAHVVLTEQPDLINGIRQNVQDNAASFGIDSSGSSTGCGVEAAELSWGGGAFCVEHLFVLHAYVLALLLNFLTEIFNILLSGVYCSKYCSLFAQLHTSNG